MWNKILALNESRYLAGTPRLTYYQACWLLALWKQTEELGWLKQMHSQVLQQCLLDLERGYRNLFQGRALPPRFRKKGLADSFRFPQGFKLEDRKIYLPKMGWVEFWKSREMEGTVKNVTLSRRGGHWYVALQAELEVPEPVHPAKGKEVGIDLGIVTFAAFSDGELVPPLNVYCRWEKKLGRLQRNLARKVKFSRNWEKRQKIAHLHIRIANSREDFLHKLSTDVSKNHATVYVENLRIRPMCKSARGTIEHPGRNVGAKAGLNKSILDQGWHRFRRMLEYKQAWRGGIVWGVDPRYSSQTCPNPECGHVSADNRQQQALFRCVQCGYSHDADVVAARNHVARGHREKRNAYAFPQGTVGTEKNSGIPVL